MRLGIKALTTACAAMMAACAPAEQGDVQGLMAKAGAQGTLLVGNKGEDTVSFIDLASGGELARLPTGRMPHEIAISPDGKQAAVVAYGGTTIDIFDIGGRTGCSGLPTAGSSRRRRAANRSRSPRPTARSPRSRRGRRART